jgi:two-component system KDP operon response regulator KdpE
MTRVLLVDDEPTIRTALSITMRAAGYTVDCAATAHEAVEQASAAPPDLVLLDLGLPDRDGTHVITRLRAWTSAPIIVISGRSGGRDKIAALDAGADDYVTKPFSTDELLARLRAAQRRHPERSESPHRRLGRYDVDLATRTLRPLEPGAWDEADGADGADDADDALPRLTRTEWAVLEALLHQPGRLMTYRDLADHVWGTTSPADNDSIRTHIARLRRKLEPDVEGSRQLVTEPGQGYRYQP